MEVLKERYTITELSEMLQLTDHALRYYEKEFGLSVPKDERGRRYYTAELANIMYKIKLMRSEGLEIKAIKKILQDEQIFNPPPVAPAADEASSSLVPATKEYQAMQVILNELGKRLANEMSYEIETAKEHLSREITKTKLELGACIENSIRKLESRLEKHFEDVDRAIGNWRQKSKRRPLARIIKGIFRK